MAFSAPGRKSAIVKVVLPSICSKQNATWEKDAPCAFAAFIVMDRAVGVPLATLQGRQVDMDLISSIWRTLEVLRQLRIIHTDLHLNNLFVTSNNATAVAKPTSNWSVSIIDFGEAFANTRELNRTETLKKGGNHVVNHRTWEMFRQRCVAIGQGALCTDTLLGTLSRKDVDKDVVALKLRTPSHPDTFDPFRESVMREVTAAPAPAKVLRFPGPGLASYSPPRGR